MVKQRLADPQCMNGDSDLVHLRGDGYGTVLVLTDSVVYVTMVLFWFIRSSNGVVARAVVIRRDVC